jgi:hypothetical protein
MKLGQQELLDIIDYWKSHYPLAVAGEGIRIQDKRHSANQFESRFKTELDAIVSHVGTVRFYTLVEELETSKKKSKEQVIEHIANTVFGHIHRGLKQEKKEKAAPVLTSKLLQSAFIYEHYLPIISVTDDQKGLFNTKTNTYDSELSYDTWEKWVNTRKTEIKQELKESVMPAKIEYNPYLENDYTFEEIAGQDRVLHVNAHSMPEWRRGGIPDKTPEKMPELFRELMEALFTTQQDIDYVCQWMNQMLTGRNETILFLYGKQGNGKGTLADICRLLVGGTNFTRVSTDFWEARFNGELMYKRLAFFDEGEMTRDNQSKIRSMTNDIITIEMKQKTPINLKNHCSFLWASNDDKSHVVRHQDRRFSVPNLKETELNDALGTDKVDRLKGLIDKQSVEFIQEIGYWIINHGDKGLFDLHKAYKDTANFHTLVRGGLCNWERKLVELLESRKLNRYDYNEDMIKLLTGTGKAKIVSFLSEFKDQKGNPLAFDQKDNSGSWWLVPTEDYMPEEVEETKFDERSEEERSEDTEEDFSQAVF